MARQQFLQSPQLVSCHGSDLRQFQSCAHLLEYYTWEGVFEKIDGIYRRLLEG